MDRPTDRDILLGLLALDAYSRGNNPAIVLSDNDPVGRVNLFKTAKDLEESGQLAGAASIGFDAAEYNFNGETIIGYRGTDFPSLFLNLPETASFLSDVAAGWATSFNIFGTSEGPLNLQHRFAEAAS